MSLFRPLLALGLLANVALACDEWVIPKVGGGEYKAYAVYNNSPQNKNSHHVFCKLGPRYVDAGGYNACPSGGSITLLPSTMASLGNGKYVDTSAVIPSYFINIMMCPEAIPADLPASLRCSDCSGDPTKTCFEGVCQPISARVKYCTSGSQNPLIPQCASSEFCSSNLGICLEKAACKNDNHCGMGMRCKKLNDQMSICVNPSYFNLGVSISDAALVPKCDATCSSCVKGGCACANGLSLSDDSKTCKVIPALRIIAGTQQYSSIGGASSQVCTIPNCGSCSNAVAGVCTTCSYGFTLSADGKSCTKTVVPTCDSSCSSCTNGACACASGFALSTDGKSCVKVVVPTCDSSCSSCTNGACACASGFALSTDGKSCVKVVVPTCDSSCSSCTNGACACASGFALSTDGKSCVKVVVPTCDSSCSSCTNGACACASGFALSTDGKSCVKVVVPTCDSSCSSCTNGACACASGFALSTDGKSCVKVVVPTCDSSCSSCTNGACACASGFALSTDGKSCVKVVVPTCDSSCSSCTNGACACASGFALSTDGKSCVKVVVPTCDSSCSSCTNGACACASGFALSTDGKSCSKVGTQSAPKQNADSKMPDEDAENEMLGKPCYKHSQCGPGASCDLALSAPICFTNIEARERIGMIEGTDCASDSDCSTGYSCNKKREKCAIKFCGVKTACDTGFVCVLQRCFVSVGIKPAKSLTRRSIRDVI